MSETGESASARKDAGDGDAGSAQRSAMQRKRGFPAPVTILTFVLIVVWVAAFFIPSGRYKFDASGSPDRRLLQVCSLSPRF